jgi:hypothetical protein
MISDCWINTIWKDEEPLFSISIRTPFNFDIVKHFTLLIRKGSVHENHLTLGDLSKEDLIKLRDQITKELDKQILNK